MISSSESPRILPLSVQRLLVNDRHHGKRKRCLYLAQVASTVVSLEPMTWWLRREEWMACGISHRTHQRLSHALLPVDCCLSHVSLPFPSLLTTDGGMSKPRVVALKFQPMPECPGFLHMFNLLYRQSHRFISVTGLCFSTFFTVASSFCNDLNLRSPFLGPTTNNATSWISFPTTNYT